MSKRVILSAEIAGPGLVANYGGDWFYWDRIAAEYRGYYDTEIEAIAVAAHEAESLLG